MVSLEHRALPKKNTVILLIGPLGKQGKSEGFHSYDRPSNLAQIWSKSSTFQSVWPWNLMDDLEKY